MKLYSNVITRQDIGDAVGAVEGVSFQDTNSRSGWFIPVREFAPRRGGNGFEFFLSGTSRHRAQHDREEFAATWVEWGIVIDALYKIDPDAKVGQYSSQEDFLTRTAQWLAFGSVRNGGTTLRVEHAPWLVAA